MDASRPPDGDDQGTRVGGWVPRGRSTRPAEAATPPAPPAPPTVSAPPSPPAPPPTADPVDSVSSVDSVDSGSVEEPSETRTTGSSPSSPELDVDAVAALDMADLEQALAETRASLGDLRAGRMPESVEGEGEVANLYGEGRDAEGLIRAVTRPGGALEKIELDPKALRGSPEELGEQLKTALNGALESLRAKAGTPTLEEVDPEAVARELDQVQELAAERLEELSSNLDRGLAEVERLASTEL